MARNNTKPKLGKVVYRVCGPEGEVDGPRAEHSHALVRAQRIAEFAEDELSLTVVADYAVGPSKTLTRVVRTEDGVVLTLTLSKED